MKTHNRRAETIRQILSFYNRSTVNQLEALLHPKSTNLYRNPVLDTKLSLSKMLRDPWNVRQHFFKSA